MTVGEIKNIKNHRVIENLLSIEQQPYVEIDMLGLYKLTEPIKIKVEHEAEDNVWCIGNDELSLYGCGRDMMSAFSDLEESFKDLIDIYIRSPADLNKMSDKTLYIQNRLKELLGVH